MPFGFSGPFCAKWGIFACSNSNPCRPLRNLHIHTVRFLWIIPKIAPIYQINHLIYTVSFIPMPSRPSILLKGFYQTLFPPPPAPNSQMLVFLFFSAFDLGNLPSGPLILLSWFCTPNASTFRLKWHLFLLFQAVDFQTSFHLGRLGGFSFFIPWKCTQNVFPTLHPPIGGW
jgi:hypothetical protein